MKHIIFIIIAFYSLASNAQDPCELSSEVNDSIGSYKNTKDYLVFERNFAGMSSYTYFSLALTDGLPTLNAQFIQKGKDFIKANCFDKNSRIYLQLLNGKIVTLLHINQENCGTSVRSDEGINNRVLQGIFLFSKDNFDDLKKSPISLMRVKYSTETADYIIKSTITSEMDAKTYQPERYFMQTLPCLEN